MRRAYEAPEEPDASSPRRSPRTKKPRLPLRAPPPRLQRFEPTSIASLPREILAEVFAYIKPTALLRTVSLTCKEWRAVSFCSLPRSISVHAYGRWAASPAFDKLVATLQPQRAVCIGCQHFPENLVLDMPSVRHLRLAGTTGRCLCHTFTRLTSLTSIHVTFGPPHEGALAVLRASCASLTHLHIDRMPTGAALGDSVAGLRNLFAETRFASLTELRITTQNSPHFIEAALSSAPLTARLRRLALHSVRRFEELVFHRLLPAPLTNLTSLSLMCFPVAADIRGFLAKCPALTDLALSVSSIMLHHVVDFAAPLLTELTLWTDSGAHSLADLARCTRLHSLEAPLSETLAQSQAVATRLTSATYFGPPSQPPIFPFMAHFTALTQLGITSDFANSGPIQDLNLPHLETIEWSPVRPLPTHLVAYYFRRFLFWSTRLRQITYDNVAIVQHSRDLLELTHFLEEANVHMRFAQLVCCVPDALQEEVKWFALHWRDISVTVLSAPEEEDSLDQL